MFTATLMFAYDLIDLFKKSLTLRVDYRVFRDVIIYVIIILFLLAINSFLHGK